MQNHSQNGSLSSNRTQLLRLIQSQRFWLGLILVLTAALVAGITYSLRSQPERAIRHVELPVPALPSLAVPDVGNAVAAEAIQQYTALQQKALQGVGMAPEERAVYEQATQKITACVGLQDDQPLLADCLGKQLRFLLDSAAEISPTDP